MTHLIDLALTANDERIAREAAAKARRRAKLAGDVADRLDDWIGNTAELRVSPRPTVLPFTWQGLCFDAKTDGDELDAVTVYAFDPEQGWVWHRLGSLADLGEALAAWHALDANEKAQAARAQCTEAWLPAEARTLRRLALKKESEVTNDAE